MDLSGASDKSLSGGRTIDNNGTTTWSGTGRFNFFQPSVFDNNAGGMFEAQSDSSLPNFGGAPQFNNTGLFKKSGGAGVTSVGIPFNNTGEVQVHSGTLSFTRTYTQTAGSLVLNGGDVSSTFTLDLPGGLLGGAGTITGNVSSGGPVGPGQSAGILHITGNYTQTSGGALNIEILGSVPESGFDQLRVSGSATLDGALNVSLGDTFLPGVGETFQVMTFASKAGGFSTINAPQCLQATLGTGDVNIEAETSCPEADLSVTKTASSEPVIAGTQLTYTLVVTNNGSATSTNTTLIDILQPGVTFAGISTTKGDCGGGPITLTCNLGTLASGASTTVMVVVEVGAATGGAFVNVASVLSAEADLVASNNTSTATTTVVSRADLSVSKSGSPDPVRPGEALTYTVTVTNTGPSAATGITVTDSLPPGVTHVSTTPSQGVCTGTGPVNCDLGTIGSNSNATVTIEVAVGLEARGTLTNTASVTGNETDLVASNDTVVSVVPIPGVSAWGLLVMAGLIASLLSWQARRRQPFWA